MRLRLSAATIKTLAHPPRGEPPALFWDTELPGFGLRLMPEPSRVKTFLIQSRTLAGRQFGMKLGRLGILTAEQARAEARKILGAVQTGQDPAKERKKARQAHRTWQSSPTLAEVDQEWRKANAGRWSANTSDSYETWIRKHVLPTLGDRRAHEIEPGDVRAVYRRLLAAGKSSTANRVLGALSAMYAWAITAEIEDDGKTVKRYQLVTSNPAKGALAPGMRVADVERVREPVGDELERLLRVLENRGDMVGTFFLLVMLTACRGGELREKAQWRDFDLDVERPVWRKPTTKNRDPHRVTLNPEAVELLRAVKAAHPWSPFGWLSEHRMRREWAKICVAAKIKDLRIHDAGRHFHASVLAACGYGLLDIGKALGHKDMKSTRRYTHVVESRQRQASTDLGQVLSFARTAAK